MVYISTDPTPGHVHFSVIMTYDTMYSGTCPTAQGLLYKKRQVAEKLISATDADHADLFKQSVGLKIILDEIHDL